MTVPQSLYEVVVASLDIFDQVIIQMKDAGIRGHLYIEIHPDRGNLVYRFHDGRRLKSQHVTFDLVVVSCRSVTSGEIFRRLTGCGKTLAQVFEEERQSQLKEAGAVA
jgi:hypothetical protein